MQINAHSKKNLMMRSHFIKNVLKCIKFKFTWIIRTNYPMKRWRGELLSMLIYLNLTFLSILENEGQPHRVHLYQMRTLIVAVVVVVVRMLVVMIRNCNNHSWPPRVWVWQEHWWEFVSGSPTSTLVKLVLQFPLKMEF